MAPRSLDSQDLPVDGPPGEGLLAFDPEVAFAHLYEAHAGEVERWVRRLAGPNADVEDLMHDVFVVALRKRAEFRGDAKLSTWLFAITQRIVRKRRFRAKLRGFLDFRHQKESEAAAAPLPTPLEELERRRDHVRLYAALDRLGEKYRSVIILCDIEGMPAAEAGLLLGLSSNAIWVRVHRGRALLLEQLQRMGKRVTT